MSYITSSSVSSQSHTDTGCNYPPANSVARCADICLQKCVLVCERVSVCACDRASGLNAHSVMAAETQTH